MSDLQLKFNTLMQVHAKTVNTFADKAFAYDELKKENKSLRDVIIRFERDNKMLQESLDGCQREIERLNEKEKRSDMLELMEEEGYLG